MCYDSGFVGVVGGTRTDAHWARARMNRASPRDDDARWSDGMSATEDEDDDVCFDPDAYEDEEDGARAVGGREDETEAEDTEDEPTTTTSAMIDGLLRRATEERKVEIAAFDAMLDETFPGTSGADARWERALGKMARDARFKAVRTHGERRSCFDAFVRRKREERDAAKKRKREEGAEDAVVRRERAMRAREAEARDARRRDEREARKRKERLREQEAEDGFRALCAERVKTYSRSYEEADLFGDPMGRDDVSALAGGETRARQIYEEHRASVEETLTREFGKLVRKILDRLIVTAVSDDASAETARRDAASGASLDALFDGAVSYARATDEEDGELDLVDDVMFTLVPDDDKKKMWSACAKEILARHDVRLLE